MKPFLTRPGPALLLFLAAYGIITVLGILLTLLFAVAFDPPTPEALGVPVTQAPAYVMTIPYHVLLNLPIWLLFGWLYLRRLPPAVDQRAEAVRLGAFWAVICIGIDLIGWVLIPHPWAMTFREFYVDYQPWITLIYLVVFIAPVMIAHRLPGATPAPSGPA
jgi:hypothetical protein